MFDNLFASLNLFAEPEPDMFEIGHQFLILLFELSIFVLALKELSVCGEPCDAVLLALANQIDQGWTQVIGKKWSDRRGPTNLARRR